MVRRLPDGFICECLGNFWCLCVVHGCVYAFAHQCVEDPKYARRNPSIIRLHTVVAIWHTSLGKTCVHTVVHWTESVRSGGGVIHSPLVIMIECSASQS